MASVATIKVEVTTTQEYLIDVPDGTSKEEAWKLFWEKKYPGEVHLFKDREFPVYHVEGQGFSESAVTVNEVDMSSHVNFDGVL